MKIVISGLGSVGRRHLRNLVVLGYRDIILLRTHKAALPESELDGFHVETAIDHALAHKPQAVIVTNPTSKHLEVAIPAAKAGCHILLEKPISHTLDRIDELTNALEKGGGRLLVGYQYRFHPTLQTAAECIAGGIIGRPLSFRCQYDEYLPDCHPWEDYRKGYAARKDLGGGVLLTFSHPLDYLRWIFGDVRALWAFVDSVGELELAVEDVAEIGLHYDNGVIGSLHLGYNQRSPSHWLEIVGTEGTLRWDNNDGMLRIYKTDPQGWREFPPPKDFQRNDMFLDEMRHFIEVVKGHSLPVCTLADGIEVLKLISAAHQSSQAQELIRMGR